MSASVRNQAYRTKANTKQKLPDVIEITNEINKTNNLTRQKSGGSSNTRDEISPSKLMVFWMSVVARWRKFTSYLYDSSVEFFGAFVADVFSHPRLQGMFMDLIVKAVNAFLDQEDIGTKMDVTARRVIYDREKAREASRALGKEVVPMVSGFVGGMASSLTPAALKWKKGTKEETESETVDAFNVSGLSLTEIDDESFEGEKYKFGCGLRNTKKKK